MAWMKRDSRMVLEAARGLSLTTGERSVLAVMLLFVTTYEDGPPVVWVDKRQLSMFTGLEEVSVKRCLNRLRKAGLVGEWRVQERRNGWKQYGYRLGPLATGAASDDAASMVDAMNLMVREERRARDPRNTFSD